MPLSPGWGIPYVQRNAPNEDLLPLPSSPPCMGPDDRPCDPAPASGTGRHPGVGAGGRPMSPSPAVVGTQGRRRWHVRAGAASDFSSVLCGGCPGWHVSPHACLPVHRSIATSPPRHALEPPYRRCIHPPRVSRLRDVRAWWVPLLRVCLLAFRARGPSGAGPGRGAPGHTCGTFARPEASAPPRPRMRVRAPRGVQPGRARGRRPCRYRRPHGGTLLTPRRRRRALARPPDDG